MPSASGRTVSFHEVWSGHVDFVVPGWATDDVASLVRSDNPDRVTIELEIAYQACDDEACGLPRTRPMPRRGTLVRLSTRPVVMVADEAGLERAGVHLIVGGFPPGSGAGHDMDFVRLRLLGALARRPQVKTTVANDFAELETWLGVSRFLITYTAGPYPNDAENEVLNAWLEDGGRWLGLHGTSGGRAERSGRCRKMVKTSHHDTLGGFFLNHPPIRSFQVDVADHELTSGVETFTTSDELYFVELTHPEDTTVLLTTELATNPAPNFGFCYDADTSILPDGRTRVIGFTRPVGAGGVTYYALGHCHDPATNSQPMVDESVAAGGTTPLRFTGSWDGESFNRLLDNAIDWGCVRPSVRS